MKLLLSLPPHLAEDFFAIRKMDPETCFCTSDPVGHKLGSGGGTAWLLESCYRHDIKSGGQTFLTWLSGEKRILMHAGGQSRRLPAYAPSGKVLTPIPVFRWKRGQRLTQDLLSLQLPLYRNIMTKAPETLHTLVASGDVYIRAEKPLQPIPQVDVVCYGLWADPELAKDHGVFVSSRQHPEDLDFMLQKPSIAEMNSLMEDHLFLMDIGIWLLSDRAVELICRRSEDQGGNMQFYDMYSQFGPALGQHPRIADAEVNRLKVVILPLPGGEFYHYGTSREMISSTVGLQNLVTDQREIKLHHAKPHVSMFVQNARTDIRLRPENTDLWIENSDVPSSWKVNCRNIITGVPCNSWDLHLAQGTCIDVVPIGEDAYAARPYGYTDTFKGNVNSDTTQFLGQSILRWLGDRDLTPADIGNAVDLQSAPLFPVCRDIDELGLVLRWMTSEPQLEQGREVWKKSRKRSADALSEQANLHRLFRQREEFRKANWSALAGNYAASVFYQIDLHEAAEAFAANHLPVPDLLPDNTDRIVKISDAMFRSAAYGLIGEKIQSTSWENKAFSLMREGLVKTAEGGQLPKLSVYTDQIVWGRSPVRIDIAGGWTDTPPYSLMEGGNVVNLAIELNGQPPLQVYVKPDKEYAITLRSIDLGAMERIETYEELEQFNKVGSPFSIPKAALALAGFLPAFCGERFASLRQQLEAFGGGIEVTLLAAIPAGSGLGTSSILAATVLGAVSDFCGLGWDKHEICHRTLVLEQLLTTGGGWQDQYGGVFDGVKLLQTTSGWVQRPLVRWLPNRLFTAPEYRGCHLLYYTGITRTAKHILTDIVRGMFLNERERLELLDEMKAHTMDMFDALQQGRFEEMGRLVGRSWQQNQRLDSGTNPSGVRALTDWIDDLCLGYKLPGAGGGGYLYMVAKDEEAARRIRTQLNAHRPNASARFVEMTLSLKGLEISRS